jgi:hypothetical protein
MKTTRIVAFAILFASFAGASAWAWDQDPFGMYIQRKDTVTLGAGDAKAVNAATHVIDPWPRYVGNRRIPMNGARAARAVKCYEKGGPKTQTNTQTTGNSQTGQFESNSQTKTEC